MTVIAEERTLQQIRRLRRRHCRHQTHPGVREGAEPRRYMTQEAQAVTRWVAKLEAAAAVAGVLEVQAADALMAVEEAALRRPRHALR